MSEQKKQYVRFSTAQRIEHVILILSFTTLAITGLVQKFSTAGISQSIILGLGGIELTRIIHRIAATIFVVQSIYHFIVAAYKLYVLRLQASMLPGIKDAKDAIQAFLYNLGIGKEQPKMPRYNFTEKAEYWAMIWGLVLMGLTGFMLWNPILTTKILPGQFIPAAKAAHGAEAVLAVLAIILWHFYNVHIKHWNWSMIRGTMSRHQMEEEHGEELEQIEAGKNQPVAVSAEALRRRRALFFPVAGLISLALLGGIYWLVTAEKTAIDTVVPPENSVPVFSPRTATPAPTAEAGQTPEASGGSSESTEAAPSGSTTATTWDGGIGALFQQKCGSCHGPAAAGGLAVDTYANLMKGGNGGAVIVPGDPSGSKLVQVQQGGHPAVFSADELQQVIDWIQAGAPEN